SCLEPCQWMRVRPWWQVRQTSFVSAEDILEKRRGMGFVGLLTCSLGSPWHIRQPTLTGARASALVPWLPAQTSWALAWQLAQYLRVLTSSAEGWASAPVGRKRSTPHAARSARIAAVPDLTLACTVLPPSCRLSARIVLYRSERRSIGPRSNTSKER